MYKNESKSYINKCGHQVYYNVTIAHDDAAGDQPTDAKFQEVRSDQLFDGPPCDYYMSVVRFTVPSSYIPLQIFPIQPYPNTDPNRSTYSVTLSFGGTDKQVFLQWSPQNTYIPTPPPPQFDPVTLLPTEGPIRSQFYSYYSLFSINYFLSLINNAFIVAFAELKAAQPSAPPTSPPFFAYDPATRLISLYAQTSYNFSQTVPTIQIFMNTSLNVNIDNSFDTEFFAFNQLSGKDVLFSIENTGTNLVAVIPPDLDVVPSPWNILTSYQVGQLVNSGGFNWAAVFNNIGSLPTLINPNWQVLPNASAPIIPWINTTAYVVGNIVSWNGSYWIALINNISSEPAVGNVNWNLTNKFESFQMIQEFPTINQMQSFTGIVITSGSIPCRSEWISGNLINSTKQTNNSSNFQRILTDFEIDLNTGLEIRSFIHYVPTAQYRYIDLLGNTPIFNLDVQVYWKDNYNNLYLVQIPLHYVLTIKMLFEKRSKYNEKLINERI
jgi:hypothetical protein